MSNQKVAERRNKNHSTAMKLRGQSAALNAGETTSLNIGSARSRTEAIEQTGPTAEPEDWVGAGIGSRGAKSLTHERRTGKNTSSPGPIPGSSEEETDEDEHG